MTEQDPAWGVQMMAEGWSDAITEAKNKIAELEQENRRLTVLERTASEHAANFDAEHTELWARIARHEAEKARHVADERRHYAERVKAENELAVVQDNIGQLEQQIALNSETIANLGAHGRQMAELLTDANRRIATVRDPETLAELFHAAYERLAPDFGYRTREESAKPWSDVPDANRALMVATCREVMRAVLDVGPEPVPEEWKALMPQLDDEHPEKRCNRCGGPNVSAWCAPSPLWNQVMRGGCINGKDLFGGIVCPVCFAALAEEAGIAWRWMFYAQKVLVPLQTTTPSGRTWNERTWLWDDEEKSVG